MRRFLSIRFNTPTEQVPFGYANAGFASAAGPRTLACFEDHRVSIIFSEDKAWDAEDDGDWNGCCEDPYDDDEENEREWCD